jgi:hypothetical protein
MAFTVANKVNSAWVTEDIPDVDLLYMRVHYINLNPDGTARPSAFFDIGDGMSTLWERYATPESTRAAASKNPMNNAVVSMLVERIRGISGLTVIHTPSVEQQGHTDVLGDKRGGDPKRRVLLSRIADVVLPYIPAQA